VSHNSLALTSAPEAQTTADTIPQTYAHALRGATIIPANTSEAIYAGTRELLALMLEQNDIVVEQIASAFFTVTLDLNAAFPAKAARQIGWKHVALLCATEIPVPGAMPMCLRVLVHFNATRPRASYRNIYIHGAEHLLDDDLATP